MESSVWRYKKEKKCDIEETEMEVEVRMTIEVR